MNNEILATKKNKLTNTETRIYIIQSHRRGYKTVCEAHQESILSSTQAQAKIDMKDTTEWCSECKALKQGKFMNAQMGRISLQEARELGKEIEECLGPGYQAYVPSHWNEMAYPSIGVWTTKELIGIITFDQLICQFDSRKNWEIFKGACRAFGKIEQDKKQEQKLVEEAEFNNELPQKWHTSSVSFFVADFEIPYSSDIELSYENGPFLGDEEIDIILEGWYE
jgi:uncharacterized protein YktA (UPF0223 family)